MKDSVDTYDVVGRWLQAAKSNGQCLDILFGRGSLKSPTIDWFSCSHLHYDGMGAFARILSDAYETDISIPLGKFPPVGKLIQQLPTITPDPSYESTPSIPSSNAKALTNRIENTQLAWHLFSQKDSKAFNACARLCKCTVNSLLLYTLNKSLEYNKALSSTFTWLIPVNLRGALSSRRPSSNQVSYLYYTSNRANCVQATHRDLHARLQCGEHWKQYHRMQSLYRLPLFLKKWILKRQSRKHIGQIGTFSNLGQWDKAVSLEKNIFGFFVHL